MGWQSGLIAAENAEVPLAAATPESQVLGGALLEQAVAEIAEGKYGDMDALLVLRNNYLVLEHYTSPLYHGRGLHRGQPRTGRRPVFETASGSYFPGCDELAAVALRSRKPVRF